MRRTLVRIALLLWVGATLYVATTAGFSRTHSALMDLFQGTLGLGPDAAGVLTNVVRKAFHVPAYGLLAALAYVALPDIRRRALVAFGLTLLVALADEGLQVAHPQRSGSVADVAVDVAGALLGLWLAGAFRRPARRPAESTQAS